MKAIEVAVRRPVTVAMGAVTLLLFGLISLSGLKVNLLPELAYPTLTVRTEFVGAAPAEIETLITRPLEESVGVVKNVRTVKSISRAGQSDVILEFAWGADMDMAGLDVREKLEILQLPLEATRPQILRFNPATDPVLRLGLNFAEGSSDAENELKMLRRFADEELKKRLEPVAGVAAVKISGGLEDEVHIDIDMERLAQLDISVMDLTQRLSAENVNVSAGRLEDGAQRYLVRTINQFDSVPEIANVIIATGSGRPVYLKDIASVEQSYKERQAIIRMNGREAVEIAVYKEGDANTVAVNEAVRQALDGVRRELPEGMQIITVDDQSVFIQQSIQEVVLAALLGGLLAMAVIFLFLRHLGSTLIIAISIPISIVATFFLMGQAGISLNIMSLGGIALATGLLVDNAIVVLENIARYRGMGQGRMEAAVNGARDVGGAVVASTLTTIAVFFPLAFVEGVAGQLFRDQALTVTFALMISLLVAITLIPMLAARWSRRVKPAVDGAVQTAGQTGDQGGRIMAAIRNRYAGLLQSALQRRALVMGLSAVLLAVSLWSLARQDLELIPQLAQGRYEVTLEMAPGTPLAVTDAMVAQVQSAADGIDSIDYAYGVSGSGNRIDANPTESGENIGRLLVALNNTNQNQAGEQDSIGRLRQVISRQPGVEADFTRPELLSFDKPLEIEVVGYNLDDLKQVSQQVVNRLQQSDRFVDIESSMERGHPEVQIYFDQERAAALGLTVKDISDQLVNTVRGVVATRYSWRDRKIDVLVRAAEADRSSVDDIRELVINPKSQRPVTLASVADIVVTEGPAEIRRADQERVAVIAANLSYGALGAAVQEAERLLRDVRVPPAMGVRVTGQNEELEASTRSLLFALGLAIFLVYLVMASQFESLLHPLVILFSVPLAAVGVALAVGLTGMPLSVMVFIGLIMLAGIVVNNAIVLIDLINHLRAQGMQRLQAIMEAAQQRLRPILMTTLTTVLGLTPMAIGLGEGAEIRAPMAVTVISGLLMSMLLTLIVIPVVYSLLDRRADQSSEQAVAGRMPWQPAAAE